MRTIAIANQKGGTGKTTTAVNLAAALTEHGQRVLLLDLDPQGNAATYLGCPDDGRALLDAFSGSIALVDTLQRSEHGIDVAPAGEWLSGVERVLASEVGREFRLREMLDELPDRWDVMIIDCPPSLGLLSICALVAADEVIIPVMTEAMPLEGLAQFLRTIRRVQERLNKDLRIAGVLSVKTEATKLSRSVENAMRQSLGAEVFETVIKKNVKVAESYSHKAPVTRYAPRSPGSKAYRALAEELESQIGGVA